MCIFEFTWSFCCQISNIVPQNDHHITSTLRGLPLPLNSNIDGTSDIEYSNKLANYGNFIAIFDLTGNNGCRKFEFKGLQDRRISNIAIKSPQFAT
jgi:hypothetical protein